MIRRLPLLLLFLLAGIHSLYACIDGTQPECMCETAPVLCTPDQLDNYAFSMSDYQHPQDGPRPLCSGAPNSVPNNPTWFAFTAWCTDLTLRASFSACNSRRGSIGVQIAIYGDCTFANQVACAVDPASCNTNDKTLVMTNLVIGQTYYFLVDGCLGSDCTVSIDIVGVCGNAVIADWTGPLMGPTNVCVGDTEFYSAEFLQGANLYHWYIDGVEITTTNDPNHTITWSTAGTYQLCIDASNDPCVPVDDPPLPLCTTVVVSEATAGVVDASPNPLCPGETSNISASGYTTGAGNTQVILLTDAAGNITSIISGDMATLTTNTCETLSACSYNYTAGSPIPFVGQNVNSIDCTTNCCDIVCTDVVFEDNDAPTFDSPPADVTLTCFDGLPAMTDQPWTDNCDGTGMATGTETGSADLCSGGSITRTWQYTDQCNNPATHTQTITVDPVVAPTFDNPPPDITVDCNNVPSSAPDLTFTNNGMGACLISGSVPAVQTGTGNQCGGQISFTWTFTDPCGNPLTHTQNVTIDPTPAPTFDNLPADMTVDCDNIPTTAPDLTYSNNVTGGCLISGSIPATVSGTADQCGGQISFTWSFTDPCGNPLTHTQNITVDPTPDPTFDNLPADITVDCDNVPTSAPDLTYTNNASGSCLIAGSVPAIPSGTGDHCGGQISFTWTFNGPCGSPITHTQNVTIDPAPIPVFDNLPPDMTVDCDNIPTSAPDLTYTNNASGNCLIAGSVPAIPSGTGDRCGGQISFTWSFVDLCGNPVSHTQNITIDPAPAPVFDNLPADIVVDCDNIPLSAPDLTYTNNASGNCLVAGSVPAIPSGNGNRCGGQNSFTWSFTDQCGNPISHTQNVTITPAPAPFFLNPPLDITVSCDNVPTNPPLLNYTNNGNGSCLVAGAVSPVETRSGGPCDGIISYKWDFVDACDNPITHTQIITIEPAPPAVFTSLPPDLTVDCSSIPNGAPLLDYTNNASGSCRIAGSVAPIVTNSADYCGGFITNEWIFIDVCNREIRHTQTITVNPAAPAAFLTLPGPITMDCRDVPLVPPALDYSNSETGICAINGSVVAIQSGAYDGCGGNISYTWVFTDNCSRTISHTQEITVNPAAEPMFSFLPPDQVINCDAPFPPALDLPYTNGETGACEISGSIPPTVTTVGTSTTYSWTLASPCSSNSFTHSQTITQDPPPLIMATPLQVTICQGDSFDLSTISVVDLNGSNLFVTYHFASPAGPGNQYPFTIVDPTETTLYYILGTNPAGCTDETVIEVVVEEPTFAGFDGNGTVCFSDASDVNLFDFLGGNPDPTGFWGDPGVTGVDLANPFNVDFSGLAPGSYTYDYTLPSTGGVCPPSTSSITIELLPEIIFDVSTIECSANPLFYQVIVTYSNTVDLTSNLGTVTDIGGNQIQITDIPIGQTLTITVSNPSNPNCNISVSVNSPDCNCPTIDPPISNGNQTICEGDPIPELSVSVGVNETANWYDASTGGLLLQPDDTTYTPIVSAVGTYLFYVETRDTISGCVSLIRTPVELEIAANPIGLDAQLTACDVDNDGFAAFDLSEAEALISSQTGLAFSFFENLADAQSGNNPLSNNYVNTSTPSQELFVKLTNSKNCDLIVRLTLLVNPPPTIDLQLAHESCLGDGDGSVTITVPNGIQYSLDSTNWSSNNIIDSLAAGNYTVYVEDGNGCLASQEFAILPGLELELENLQITCNNNGTPSDDTDDFYTIVFTLNNSQGIAGTFVLNDGVMDIGTYNYGTSNSITVPASGQSFTYTFTDSNLSCTLTQAVGPLTPCSSECTISIDQLDFTCSDNGTDTDPSDDFYTMTILATATNGATNNTYNVLVNGLLSFNFPYGVPANFSLPADGSSPIITVVDNQDNQCRADLTIGPLTTCSDACVISFESVNFACNDNGTITDPLDDFYEFSIMASALNPGTNNNFEVFVDNVSQGIFNYSNAAVFNLPANNTSVLIRIVDVDDPNCFAEQTVGPLEACEEDCEISAIVSNILCNDNGTGNDPNDDTFTFELLVSGQNTGAGWQATSGAINGTYGNTETFGPFLITGGVINFDLQDLTTANCTTPISVTPPASCSTPCQISFDLVNFNCNNNGTITDPSDDFYEFVINASASNAGASNSFEVFIDNVSQGIFNYATGANFNFPANNNSVVVRIVDADFASCSAEQTVGPLASCEEDCSITAAVSNIICNDNGTGNDPNDDTFTFELVVNGQNTGAGWQATSGAINGTYGNTETFGPYPINGGAVNFDLQDLTTANCTTPISVTPPASCSTPCQISFDLVNFNCNNNGTITDPSDDFYEFVVNASASNAGASNAFEVFIDNVSQGVFDYASGANFNFPANNNSVVVRIVDADFASCSAEQTVGPLASCEEDCTITATVSNIICDDNGTGNDPNDDTFTFELVVNGQNTGAGWQATSGSINGTYGNTETFGPYPINGGAVNFDLQDLTTANCTTPISVTPPASCSTPCQISFDLVNFNCNDNGTITDPSDDFYEFVVNASASNAGASNAFEVFIDNVSQGTFNYAAGANFNFPANNNSVVVRIVDADFASCSAEQTIGPLASCEEDCSITATVSNILCDDNGTGNDPNDDTFTFELLVNGQNTGAGWQATSGAINGTYGNTETFGPFLITGGVINFDLQDLTTANCTTPISVTPPASCSTPCQISFDLVNFNCNNNGTITDPSDDFYEFVVNASASNAGASNSFEVFIDNVSQGIFNYATGANFNFPANNNSVVVRIVDADFASCSAEQTVGPLASCEEDCTITATVSNILCDDNGTGNDPNDDTFTFELLVNGQNTGAGWQATSGAINGTYGVVQTYGPYPISGGIVNFDLQDLTTANCTTPISVTPPANCSDPCQISFDLIDFNCNNNGTITDPSDDFYEFVVNASASNAGASNAFEVFIDNVSQGIFNYASGANFTIPANNNSVVVRIVDADVASCFAEQTVGPLAACEEDCTITASVSNILCDDNGTGNDPNDDTFTFELVVNGQNTGAGWQAASGAINGTYGVVQTYGPYPISGGVVNFDLQDLTTANCTTPISVTPPASCSTPCQISFDLIDFNCNNNGTITDPSDDFYEFVVNASASNAGASNSFEVFIDNVSQGIFNYASGANFTIPANNNSVVVRIVDADEASCFAEQTVGPLAACEEDCTITASVSNILCDDNGTGNDPNDDTFTFELVVNGQNTGAGWQATSGAINGTYGVVQTYGPYPIAGGAVNFDLQDLTTANCTTPISVTPPANCSDPCQISFDLIDFNCNNNGTITDPSDDFYEFVVNASASNGGASNSFEVFIDNVSQGIFNYASGANFTIPANNNSVVVRIVDADVTSCFAEQTVGPLAACEEDCTITASVSNILCDDNGTGDDPTDDTFTFELLVNGQNLGAGWQATTGAINGTYGNLETFGPYPISGGQINFDLQDLTTPTCIAAIQVDPPQNCSSCLQTLDAGIATEITCTQTSVTLNGLSSEMGMYRWEGPNTFTETDLTVSVIDSGWYFLTTTYPNGCELIDSVYVGANTNEPVAVAGPDQFLSCDVEEVFLDGTLSSGGTNIVYEWQNEAGDSISNEPRIMVNTAGTYFLQLTDTSNGCTSIVDEVMIVDSTAAPTAFIYADPDNILDCQVSSILLYTDDQDNVMYLWNSVPDSQITISEAGTVILVVIDTITGCESTDEIIITDLSDYPFVNLNPVDSLTCYSPSIVIDGSGSQSGPNLVYNWFNGQNELINNQDGDTLLVNESGFYILQIVDTLNGCENSDTVFVKTLLDDPLQAVINQVGALDCNNTSYVLDASGSVPVGGLSFSWSTADGNIVSGANSPNPEINTPGSYILTILNTTSGCVHVDTIQITENIEEPDINILPSATITCFVPETVLDASASFVNGNSDFSWSSNPAGGIISGDNTLRPMINQGGVYILTMLNLDNGCESMDSIIVDEDTALPTAMANVQDELDCLVDTVGLDGTGSSTGSGFDYNWSGPGILNDPTNLEILVNRPGPYQLRVINTQNGCEESTEVQVIENDNVPSALDVRIIAPLCFGDQGGVEILEVEGGEPPYLYSIDGGENYFSTEEFSQLDPGNYDLIVQDAIGCTYAQTFSIPTTPLFFISIQPEVTIGLGSTERLQAVVNIPNAQIDSINWTPIEGLSCIDCLDPLVTPINETNYTITVIDIYGCEAMAEVRVKVDKERNIFIPNVFSPNGDGSNDKFLIFADNDQIKQINSFEVFDRWGELIFRDFNFQPGDPSHGWDGTLRGQAMDPAVFVYWAEIEFIDGVKKLYSGDVTLVR